MKRYVVPTITLLLLSLIVLASDTQKVSFEGEWQNGTTLYSEKYDVSDANNISVWSGRNGAYPITEEVCENVTVEERERVCERICYDTRKICYLLEGEEQWCEEKEYSRERCKTSCKYEYTNVTKEKCYDEGDIRPFCDNPFAPSTNQLHYSNFYYRLKNESGWGNWINLPVRRSKEYYIDINKVQVKVDIPSICYPEYDIDDVVYLEEN